jgi:hypothetical protein
MLQWIQAKWKRMMSRNVLPADYNERMRIKAFILGAGAPPGRDGTIEIEDEKDKKHER